MMGHLADQKGRPAIVAVAGGSRGIGRAIAAAYRRRGAIVAVGDPEPEVTADAAAAIGAHPFSLQIASRESTELFLQGVERTFGPVGVFVNATPARLAGAFLAERDRTSRDLHGTVVCGAMNGLRAALPPMLERGEGRIIQVSSLLGRVPQPGAASLSAAEHAVVALGTAVRAEVAATGVRVTTVIAGADGRQVPWNRPARRLLRATPHDVARAIVGLRGDPGLLWVPRGLAAYPIARAVLPEALGDWLVDPGELVAASVDRRGVAELSRA